MGGEVSAYLLCGNANQIEDDQEQLKTSGKKCV